MPSFHYQRTTGCKVGKFRHMTTVLCHIILLMTHSVILNIRNYFCGFVESLHLLNWQYLTERYTSSLLDFFSSCLGGKTTYFTWIDNCRHQWCPKASPGNNETNLIKPYSKWYLYNILYPANYVNFFVTIDWCLQYHYATPWIISWGICIQMVLSLSRDKADLFDEYKLIRLVTAFCLR